MNVGKTCGMAVIVVAIIPVILGMVWPDGTETVDVYDVDRGIDITGDLSNRIIPVYDSYTGPLNNLTVYDPYNDALVFPTPRETTDVPNAYPTSDPESGAAASTVTISDMAASSKARFEITGNMHQPFSVSGDATPYYMADYWPATNVLVLFDGQAQPVKTYTPDMDATITGNLWVVTFSEPTGYMDVTQGLISPATAWAWLNEQNNEAVEVWVKVSHTTVAFFQCDSVRLSWNSSIYVTVSNVTTELGSVYDYVSIRMTKEKITVTGLIGVSSFADRTYTEGNAIEYPATGHLDVIPMAGAYADWWVVVTTSNIGKATGIYNSSFSPEAYYGVHSWQFQIINPSTFGDSLVFSKNGVNTAYPIDDSRTITVTNLVTGEESKEAVRGMRVLSLIEGGAQNVYINGIKAIQYPASGNVTVTLSGPWMASIVTAKVVQSQQERYTWDTASFGFDQTAFCTVGMLSCALVGIVGSFWGKRTGESVAALYLVMGVCAAAYIIMIP